MHEIFFLREESSFLLPADALLISAKRISRSLMFFLISNLGIYFYRSPAVHCIICFAYKGNKNTVDSRGYLYEYCANDIRFDDYFQADSPASVYFKTLNFKISSSFPRRLSQYKFLRFSDWFLGSRISFRCVSWNIKVLTR